MHGTSRVLSAISAGHKFRYHPSRAAWHNGFGVGLVIIGWCNVWVLAHRETFTVTIAAIIFTPVLR